MLLAASTATLRGEASEVPLAGPQAEACGRLAQRWLPQALRGRPLAESLEAVTSRVRSVFGEIFG